MRFIAILLFLSVPLSAQQLTVSLSTNSPAAGGVQGGAAFTQELAALTLTASGGAVMVDGITLTASGTGDFASDLDASTGLSVWQDDGDGSFNSTLDTNLGSTGGASPTITVNFTSTLTVPDATSVELWVVGDFLASAGASVPDTYQVAITNTSDVNTQGAPTVSFGTPVPNSASLSVVIFFVTTVSSPGFQGDGVSLIGSGFTTPISLSIDGIDLGTASVYSGNTIATGWVVPDLGSSDGSFDVVVTTSLLGPITLTQQFNYRAGKPGGRTGNDCSTSESGSSWFLPALLATLAALFATPRIIEKPTHRNG